ncbi:hypothetical protein PIB30_108658, partial [Stylosanthes scabra]|nr:hypothetical protein [Stylosanthes scabra]
MAKPIAIKGTASEPTKPAEDWVLDAERSPKKKKEKKGSARAKSSSTATLTSRKWNAVEHASNVEGPVAKMARTSQPHKKSKKAEGLGKLLEEQIRIYRLSGRIHLTSLNKVDAGDYSGPGVHFLSCGHINHGSQFLGF